MIESFVCIVDVVFDLFGVWYLHCVVVDEMKRVQKRKRERKNDRVPQCSTKCNDLQSLMFLMAHLDLRKYRHPDDHLRNEHEVIPRLQRAS